MIKFKEMYWSNFFSYGTNNYINFEDSTLTQLLGLNGVGKTSIPLIIQEVLYGKNVKKIAKTKLVNRNAKDKKITATLSLSVDSKEYTIQYTRTTTKLTVELISGKENLSSHTAPATMKSIENILGIDFDTFAQLVYQSSKSSLQFLTATDTHRKRFLITLFNLEKYTEIFDTFKSALVETNKELSNIQGRYAVYEEWIRNHSTIGKTKELLPLPDLPVEEIETLNHLKAEKLGVTKLNKQITKNKAYQTQLDSIDKNLLNSSLSKPEGIQELRSEKISISTIISEKQKFIKEIEGKSDKCPTCKQKIDLKDSKDMAEKYREEIEISNSKLEAIITQLKNLEKQELEDGKIKKAIEQFENLTNLVDKELPSEIIQEDKLQEDIDTLADKIQTLNKDIKNTKEANDKVILHNAKIKGQKEQLTDYNNKLNRELTALDALFEHIGHLELLKEAFGTNGLVSYKLEYLTKDLEQVINEYLAELSRGRFQLNFVLKGDKLNIDVTDTGEVITINEVSEGELSKINVSTLLAIRKLMQNLSNTKLNLLFLDEIMGVLDDFGREDLINVLLAEESLNTYVVTHSYRHPLVPVLSVVQENSMSRIENE